MDGLARMFAEKAMNYAQKNPDKLKSLGKKAFNYASDPAVQKTAMNWGRKGYQTLEANPQLKAKALQALNPGSVGATSELEQRVAELEEQMNALTMMLQQQGGKTRKQRKYKAKKTRKH